jgi:hypothetical protein
VIDENAERTVVLRAKVGSGIETGLLDFELPRPRFEFTIPGMLLPHTWRLVVRHQQFDDDFARRPNVVGTRDHLETRLDGPNASGVHGFPAHFHNAEATHPDRGFILLMA